MHEARGGEGDFPGGGGEFSGGRIHSGGNFPPAMPLVCKFKCIVQHWIEPERGVFCCNTVYFRVHNKLK